MDTSKSDNEFIKDWYADASMIKNNYKVVAFPTYLFFSPNGDIVHKDLGTIDSDDFIGVGADVLNSEKQYYMALEKYRKNELDPSSIKRLALTVMHVEGKELAHRIANDYIDRLSIDSLFIQDNI